MLAKAERINIPPELFSETIA
jgi:hypothetical protein